MKHGGWARFEGLEDVWEVSEGRDGDGGDYGLRTVPLCDTVSRSEKHG